MPLQSLTHSALAIISYVVKHLYSSMVVKDILHFGSVGYLIVSTFPRFCVRDGNARLTGRPGKSFLYPSQKDCPERIPLEQWTARSNAKIYLQIVRLSLYYVLVRLVNLLEEQP